MLSLSLSQEWFPIPNEGRISIFCYFGLNPILLLSFPKMTKRIVLSNITFCSPLYICIYFFFHIFFFFSFILKKILFLEEHILKITQNNSLFLFMLSPTCSLLTPLHIQDKKGKGGKHFRLGRDICSFPNKKVYM